MVIETAPAETVDDEVPGGPGDTGPDGLAAACDLLRALGAPHRLAIVFELARGPRCVHELVTSLDISQSLASQHLRVLRTAGLVVGTRRGKETAYALADEHVAHIAADALAHSRELGRPGQRSMTTSRTPHEQEKRNHDHHP
jgi:DNA-binding transcriptional ArsR family regulator